MPDSLRNFSNKSNTWIVENFNLEELKSHILDNYFINGTILVSSVNKYVGDYLIIYEGSKDGQALLTVSYEDFCFPFDFSYLSGGISIDKFLSDNFELYREE